MTPLRAATPAAWLPIAVSRCHETLVDHAHCEKKAAAHAITLVSQYPEQSAIVPALIALAQEELRHFQQVFRLLEQRHLTLSIDPGDPYVKALMGHARHSRLERLIDRLLIASLVEARSAERLALLAHGFAMSDGKDAVLAPFYARLAKAEAGHHRLFVRLANLLVADSEVQQRLSNLADIESKVMMEQPILPRIH